MSNSKNIDIAKNVIDIESKAVAAIADKIGKSFEDAVSSILSCSGRLIILGMGKSGLISQKIAATMSSTGTPSHFVHPADAFHGDLGMITKDDVVKKYLKNRVEITFTKIHSKPTSGVVTGLWANSLGKGGIIPIESVYFPSTNLLDFKLTGLQGDVMKESGNVAKSLAWKLTSVKQQKKLIKQFEETKLQGVQLHCPEGATPKDGPSAGTAMTVAIYSLFNKKKVKNNIAITGEINLQGSVTAIGGLKLKILGGIKAGVKTFIYPKSNTKDFDKFMEKYSDKPVIDGIQFHAVEHIADVLKLVFV